MHADIPTKETMATMRRLKLELMMLDLMSTSIEGRYEAPELSSLTTSMTTSKRRRTKQRDTAPKAKPKKTKKLGRRDTRRRR